MCAYSWLTLCSFVSLGYGFFSLYKIFKADQGDKKMQEISYIIRSASEVYMKKQYTVILCVALIIAPILYKFTDIYSVIGFFIGGVLSCFTGYIGMFIAVRANVRTTAATMHSLSSGFQMAFRSGSVTGLFLVFFALFTVAGYYYFLQFLVSTQVACTAIMSLSFGASLISIFARLGGGIFTKGADIGADMVGKLENGLQEDDIKNPATIADNVGDNVGDCAGMAADLFESYIVGLSAALYICHKNTLAIFESHETLPLGDIITPYIFKIAAANLISCVISMIVTRLIKCFTPNQTIFIGMMVNFLLSALSILYIGMSHNFYIGEKIIDKYVLFNDLEVPISFFLIIPSIVGLLMAVLIIPITTYYTSAAFKPLKSIISATKKGAAMNIIQGLSVGMGSVVIPLLLVIFGACISALFSNTIGISLAVSTMLSFMAYITAMDMYGPIVDNSGCIATMSTLPQDVRKNTDILDATGNTTKAITKGYAMISGGLSAFVLLDIFMQEIDMDFSFFNPFALAGVLIGGIVSFVFCSSVMQSVCSVAETVVENVRNQLSKSDFKPDYLQTVFIITNASLKKMIIPALLPVLTPIALYMFFSLSKTTENYAYPVLAGFLCGIIIVGMLLALFMTNGGAAFDNTKKYMEKNGDEDAQKAAIIGDTVGDPMKDAAGPSLNAMIKVANIVAILIVTCYKT